MSNTSKFIELKKIKLPHDKKTIKIYGEKYVPSKFFKFCNCGFLVDSKKHPSIPNTTGTPPNSFTSFPDWVNLMALETTGEHEWEVVCEDNVTNILVSGDLYYSDISIGCPFCGTQNYR